MDDRIGIDSTLLGVAGVMLPEAVIKGGKGAISVNRLNETDLVEVYSVNGALILRERSNGLKSKTIALQPGIYLVKVSSGRKTQTTKKIVVS